MKTIKYTFDSYSCSGSTMFSHHFLSKDKRSRVFSFEPFLGLLSVMRLFVGDGPSHTYHQSNNHLDDQSEEKKS